jgi:hypothetical protein
MGFTRASLAAARGPSAERKDLFFSFPFPALIPQRWRAFGNVPGYFHPRLTALWQALTASNPTLRKSGEGWGTHGMVGMLLRAATFKRLPPYSELNQSKSLTVVSTVTRVAEIAPMMWATLFPAVSKASKMNVPV